MSNIVEKIVPLYDYEGYLISNKGYIKSVDRIIENKLGVMQPHQGRILKPRRTKKHPHLFVELHYREGDKYFRKTIYLQRAVADHFVVKPSSKHVISTNVSSDFSNNSFTNIKWITQSELSSKVANLEKSWKTRKALYGSSGIRK